MTNDTATKERPILFSAEMVRAIMDGRKTQTRRVVKHNPHPDCPYHTIDGFSATCPYGQPGDRLWVREKCFGIKTGATDLQDVCYAVNCPCGFSESDHAKQSGWTPSRFMPRWASRIDLAITNVRVERVQDIDNNGAYAEGTPDIRTIENNWDLRDCFERLWGSINCKREGCSWADNPWVWVIEFERIKP